MHFVDKLNSIGPLHVGDRDKLRIINFAQKEVLKEEAWIAFLLGVFSSRTDHDHPLYNMYANGKDLTRKIRRFLHHVPWIRSMRQIVAHAPAMTCRIQRGLGPAFGSDHPRNEEEPSEEFPAGWRSWYPWVTSSF